MSLCADYCEYLLFPVILVRIIRTRVKKLNPITTHEHFPFRYVMFINSVSDCHMDKLAAGNTAFPKVSGKQNCFSECNSDFSIDLQNNIIVLFYNWIRSRDVCY
jgi:hypothetical protein